MIDILQYYPRKGCVQSRDLFNFGEISDNISLKVHDRDSCIGTQMGNLMWPIEWHHCQ